MIFVTLGTQDKSFSRLLKAVEKEIEKGKIKDHVIVQAGYTKYESKVMEIFDSISRDEFEKYIKDADLIITHGGVGSILTALEHKKKVIASPRLAKYREHTNDHQKQIVTEFAKEGYILALKDFGKFDKVLEKAKTFVPKQYVSHRDEFQQLIRDYLEKEDYTSWYNRDRKMILVLSINFLLFSLLGFTSLNPYLSLTISYLVSCLLAFLLKNKRLHHEGIVITYFYMLEFSFFLLFYDSLKLPFSLAKLFINIIFIFLYHILDKRQSPGRKNF